MAKQVIGNDLLELFANNNKDASALPGAEASTPVVQSTPAPTQTYTEAPSKVATGIGQVISAPLKAMAAPVRAVSKGVDKLIDDNTNSKLLGAINKGAKSVTSALSNDALTNAGERALVGAADTIDSFAAAPAAKRAAFNAFEQNTIGNGVRTAQNIQLSKEYRQRALEADTKAREIREKDISGNLLGEGYKAFRAQTEEDRSKLSTAGQFISDLGYSTGQMAPGIAASALTGGALGAAGVGEATVKTLSSAAGLATMYKNVYSNTYSENRNNGYDISESSKNANAKALIEVATEIAGGGLALTDMGGLTEAGLSKAGTALSRVGEKLIGSDAGIKAAGNAVIGLGKFLSNDFVQEVIGEGSEEWMSEFLGPYADRFTINENAELSTPEDRAKAFLGGALMGVALEGSQRFVQRVAKTGKTLAYNAAAKAVEVKDSFGKTEKSIPISDEAIKATHGEAAETEATPQEAAAQSVAQEEAKQQKLSEEELMAREAAAVLKTIQLNPEVTAEELVARYPLVGEELIARIRTQFMAETAAAESSKAQTEETSEAEARPQPSVESVKKDIDTGKTISEILTRFDNLTAALSSVQQAVAELTAESKQRASSARNRATQQRTTTTSQTTTNTAQTAQTAQNNTTSAEAEVNRTSGNMKSSAVQRSDRDRLHAAVILANAMILEGNKAIGDTASLSLNQIGVDGKALGLSSASFGVTSPDAAVTPLVYTDDLTWDDFTSWYNNVLVRTKQDNTGKSLGTRVTSKGKDAWDAFKEKIDSLPYGKGAAAKFITNFREGKVKAVYGEHADELTALFLKADADIADSGRVRIKAADGSVQSWTVDKLTEKRLRDKGDNRTWRELSDKERAEYTAAFKEMQEGANTEVSEEVASLNKQLNKYGLKVVHGREANRAYRDYVSMLTSQLEAAGVSNAETTAKRVASNAYAFTLANNPGVIYLNSGKPINKDTIAQIIPHEIVEKAKARNQSLDLSKAVAEMANAMGLDYNIFRSIVERLYPNLKGNENAINDEVNARFLGYCFTSMDFMAELAKADRSVVDGFKSYLEASEAEYSTDDSVTRLQRQLIADIVAVLNNEPVPVRANYVHQAVADEMADSRDAVNDAVREAMDDIEAEGPAESATSKATPPESNNAAEGVFTEKAKTTDNSETPKINRYAKAAMTRFRNKSLPNMIAARDKTTSQVLDWAELLGKEIEAKYSIEEGSVSEKLRAEAYAALEKDGAFDREIKDASSSTVEEEDISATNTNEQATPDEYQEAVDSTEDSVNSPRAEETSSAKADTAKSAPDGRTAKAEEREFKLGSDSVEVDDDFDVRADTEDSKDGKEEKSKENRSGYEDRNYESIPYYLWSSEQKARTGESFLDSIGYRFDFAADRVHIVKPSGMKSLSDTQKALLRKFEFKPVKIRITDTIGERSFDGTEDVIVAQQVGEPEREQIVKSQYKFTGDWVLPSGKASIDFWDKYVGADLAELKNTATRKEKNYSRGGLGLGRKAGVFAHIRAWLNNSVEEFAGFEEDFRDTTTTVPFPGIPGADIVLDDSFVTRRGRKRSLVVHPKYGSLPRFYVDVLRGLGFSRPMLDGTMYKDYDSETSKSIWNTCLAIAENAMLTKNESLFDRIPPDFLSSAGKQLHKTYPIRGAGGHLYVYFSSYDINNGDQTLSTSGTIHIGTNSSYVDENGRKIKGAYKFTPAEKAYLSGKIDGLNLGLGLEYDRLTGTYVTPFNIPLWEQLVDEEVSGVTIPVLPANAAEEEASAEKSSEGKSKMTWTDLEKIMMAKLEAANEDYADEQDKKHRFDDYDWEYANGTNADGVKPPKGSQIIVFVPRYENEEARVANESEQEAARLRAADNGEEYKSKPRKGVDSEGRAILLRYPIGGGKYRYSYTAYSAELYSKLLGEKSSERSSSSTKRKTLTEFIPKGKIAHTKPKILKTTAAGENIVKKIPELDGAMTYYAREAGEDTGHIVIVPKDIYTAKSASDLDVVTLRRSNNLSKNQTFVSLYKDAVWRITPIDPAKNQYGLAIILPDTTENRRAFGVADPSRGEPLFADNADAALVELRRGRDLEEQIAKVAAPVTEYSVNSPEYKPFEQIVTERDIMLGAAYKSPERKAYEINELRREEARRAERANTPKRYLPGINENSTKEEIAEAVRKNDAARQAKFIEGVRDVFLSKIESSQPRAPKAEPLPNGAKKNLFTDTSGETLSTTQARFFATNSAGKDADGKLIRFKYQSESGKPTLVPTAFGNGYQVFTGDLLVDSNVTEVYVLGNKRLDKSRIADDSESAALYNAAVKIARENRVDKNLISAAMTSVGAKLYDKILGIASVLNPKNPSAPAIRLASILGYDVIEVDAVGAKNGSSYIVLGESQMIDASNTTPNGTSALAVFSEDDFDQFYESIKNMAANIPDAEFITNTSGNQKYAAQGEEFGTFRKTDNPDSPTTDIPKKASKGTKNSKFLRNALTDENLSPEMRDALVRNAAEGNYAYIPLPNDEVARKASIGFERAYAHKSADGEVRIDIDKACNAFEAKSKGRKMLDAEEIYQGILLYQTLKDKASATFDGVFDEEQYARNLAAAEKIVAELVIQGNMHGRAVQIMSVLKKTTRFGRKYLATRSVEKVIDDLAATKKGVPASLKGFLESEEWKDINAKFDKATTEAEYEAVEEELIKLVADRIPPTLSSRASAYRYLCMLGNPKTHIRNVASNAAMYVARSIADVGTGIAEDVFLGKNATAERYQTAKKPTQQMKDFAARMWEIEKESVTHGGTKLDFDAKLKDAKRSFGDNAVGNVFEKMSKLNSTALGAEDGTFEGLHYRKALAGWLAANADKGWTVEAFENASKRGDRAMLDILDKGKTYAADTALKMTYNNANVLANKLTELEKMDGIGGDIAKILLEGIVPFKRTPMNVLVQGIKYSPLGVVYGVAEAAGMYNSSKAKAISDISQGLTGTMALGLGIWAGLLGKAKASGLDSDKEEYYDQMIGNQDFSVTVGDTNYTLDWLTPVSMPFFAGVAASDMLREKASSGELDEVDDARLGEAIVNALSKMADPVTNLSMLQGLNTALDSYSDNKLGALATNAVQSYALQFVPTVGGQLIRTMEGERKSTYAPKDSDNIFGQKGEQFVNKLRNKSLIAHTVLGENEDYIDMWGRTEDHSGNILANAAEQFLSPGYIKKANKTEVDDKLAEVFAESKDNSVLPSTPQSYLTIDKEKFYLSSEEYRDLKQTVGSISYESVDSAFKSDLFDSLTADGKAKVISNIYTYARAKAKDDYAKANGIEYDADADLDKIAAAEATGLSAGEYYIIKYKLSKCEGKKDAKGKTISSAAEAKKMYARSIGLSREQREIFGL